MSQCVEIATTGKEVLVRSSVSPQVLLTLSRGEWRNFLADAKKGLFDQVLGNWADVPGSSGRRPEPSRTATAATAGSRPGADGQPAEQPQSLRPQRLEPQRLEPKLLKLAPAFDEQIHSSARSRAVESGPVSSRSARLNWLTSSSRPSATLSLMILLAMRGVS